MTNLDFTPEACYEHVQNIQNTQVYLTTGSCPEHIIDLLNKHQLDMLEDLSTMLCMLKNGITSLADIDEKASTNGNAAHEENQQ